MRRKLVVLAALICGLFPLAAFSQEQQPSLGDLARKVRKEKESEKGSTAPPKVFTNDNFGSGAAEKSNLAGVDDSQASPADRIAKARAALARGKQILDTLDPLDRSSLAKLALEGRDVNFPGRRVWESKLFAAKQHYVAHGRELFRETEEVLDNIQSLTSGGKLSPSDPRAQDLAHRALQLMQDANRTEADFDAVVLEGQDAAKQAAAH